MWVHVHMYELIHGCQKSKRSVFLNHPPPSFSLWIWSSLLQLSQLANAFQEPTNEIQFCCPVLGFQVSVVMLSLGLSAGAPGVCRQEQPWPECWGSRCLSFCSALAWVLGFLSRSSCSHSRHSNHHVISPALTKTFLLPNVTFVLFCHFSQSNHE